MNKKQEYGMQVAPAKFGAVMAQKPKILIANVEFLAKKEVG